jgi:hypothetical protein
MGQRASRFDAAKGQVLANLAEMLVTQLESKWVTALQVRMMGVLRGWGRGLDGGGGATAGCPHTRNHTRTIHNMQAAGNTSGLLRASACYSSAYLVLDLSALPWRVLHMNEPAIQLTGVCVGGWVGGSRVGRRLQCACPIRLHHTTPHLTAQ